MDENLRCQIEADVFEPVKRTRLQVCFPCVYVFQSDTEVFIFNAEASKAISDTKFLKVLVGKKFIVFEPTVDPTYPMVSKDGRRRRISSVKLMNLFADGWYRLYPYKNGFAMNRYEPILKKENERN